MPPHRVGSENGYTFCPFWSGIGYGFQGNYRVYERIYRFKSKWVRKKEKYVNPKCIWIIFFCLCSNLSNYNSNFCLEARSENGCGKLHFLVWNRVRIWRTGRHTPPKIPRSTPTPGKNNKTHLNRKDWVLALVLKMRVFGTWK